MTDKKIELLIDLHVDAERQGPGSESVTRRALDLIGLDPNIEIKIADIGCGTGAQTMTLAENTKGSIVAIDLSPEFLEKLAIRTELLNFQDRVSTKVHSMEKLPFADEVFDLIWSEGAIYNMGFEEGISQWRRLIKPGGYLAVSEISWLTGFRPKELEQYWLNEYSQMDTISGKIGLLEKHGYAPVAHFVLPPDCWLRNYYHPMQTRFIPFLEKHGNSDLATSLVDNEKTEINLYEKFNAFFGYGFYIAQKR